MWTRFDRLLVLVFLKLSRSMAPTLTTGETAFVVWLLVVVISTIYLIPATYILIRERRKRKEHPLFASKYLSFFSYSVICLVPVWTVNCGLLYFMPGICLISHNIATPLAALFSCLLESYQLSRLYYCFSADKVHSNKGYSRWIYVLIATLMTIGTSAAAMNEFAIRGLHTQCGVRKNGDAYFVAYTLLNTPMRTLVVSLSFPMILTTDLSIMTLYWWKSRSLAPRIGNGNEQNRVYIRIRLVLNRILVLSFFYLIIHLWWISTFIIGAAIPGVEGKFSLMLYFSNWILWNGSPLSASYSVYLMQDHNTTEYIQFLSILNKYKLYFCCCCCYGMVRDQYQFVLENREELQIPKRKTITTMDTRNISEYAERVDARHNATGVELSVATETECHYVYLADIE